MIYISNISNILFLLSSVLYLVTLVYASVQDAKYHRISDNVHIVIGILAVLRGPHLSGFFAVSLPMLVLSMISKGGFGGGDIKLSAVCGLYLGVRNVVNGTMIGILLAGTYILVRSFRKPLKRKDQIAFGPYLAAGYLLTAYFGNQISNWFF